MKKSFILHLDSLDVVDKLTTEMKANLFQAIIDYNRGKELNLDNFTDIIFTSFKNQFDRDNEKYESIVERNQQNIGKRWNKNSTKNTTGKTGIPNYTKNTDNDSKNKNKKESINISFDEVWNLYDKKTGEKNKLSKKWEALKDEDRILIMAYIPQYIRSQPDKQYRKNFETFLNNKSWLDEIVRTPNAVDIPKVQPTKTVNPKDYYDEEAYLKACKHYKIENPIPFYD